MTRNQLKALFETGDRPKGEDFAALIDSMVNIDDDGAPLVSLPAAPEVVGDAGAAGNFAEDGDYLYIYSGTAGEWRRIPMAGWE